MTCFLIHFNGNFDHCFLCLVICRICVVELVKIGRHPKMLSKGSASLRRKNPVSGKRKSFAKVAKELAEMGYLNSKGNAFPSTSIKRMIES